jgi:hypothetical protein
VISCRYIGRTPAYVAELVYTRGGMLVGRKGSIPAILINLVNLCYLLTVISIEVLFK